MAEKSFELNEADMTAFAGHMAQQIVGGMNIYFHGHLGAGKTTFVRGMLRGLGYTDKVKSPTYTIVEPYDIADKIIYHFDLYRLLDSAELEAIGIADYFHPEAICLVEWPEKGSPLLPVPDVACYIESMETGRKLRLVSQTARGEQWLQAISSK